MNKKFKDDKRKTEQVMVRNTENIRNKFASQREKDQCVILISTDYSFITNLKMGIIQRA